MCYRLGSVGAVGVVVVQGSLHLELLIERHLAFLQRLHSRVDLLGPCKVKHGEYL